VASGPDRTATAVAGTRRADAAPDEARVDKVVRIVGVSTESWEDAARVAVAEAAKSIRDLASARAVELDSVVRDGRVATYRTKIEVTFRVDRSRVDRAGQVVEVRRYLIVGNESLRSASLARVVADHMAAGPAEFHVLVPCTPVRGLHEASFIVGDPLTGYIDPAGMVHETEDDRSDGAYDRARDRLDDYTAHLEGLGAEVTGEIGVADPIRAVQHVLHRASFDGIVLATQPAGMSRWLKMDLPSRLGRVTELPIDVVSEDGTRTLLPDSGRGGRADDGGAD
jgi:flavin-binding protein dodecin